ncbi:iron uptake porin [Anthocerotibacter panamensis]|uniref:iron uptake porin n=1 Tax=Anthocerotibacter panamensis TaxID=2857077 RepID=UPI001C40212F|nr:iron uptake porin [Anthocerotibacter panamensis]
MKHATFPALASLAALLVLAQGVQALPGDYDARLVDQYAQGLGISAISQVSSVSELTDVDPNGFAFQALKSLVERYGCIEGYPSKVYLGNKALTRYEFAAGLNACLEKVNELIAAGTADKITKDDLASIQRLQEEFKAELATLRGRVDALEAKAKELESQQFSTTTKLDGSVVFNVIGGGASASILANPFSSPAVRTGGNVTPGNAGNTVFTARTTLNFRSSFTGKDELRIRVRGFTGQDFSGVFSAGTGVGTLFNSGTNPNTNGISTANFDKVYYTTPLTDNFRIWIGPRIQTIDIIDTNSFAGGDDVSTFATILNSFSPLISGTVQNGPGGAFDWTINDFVSLRGLYVATSGGQSFGFGSGGLTGGTFKAQGELEIRPTRESAIRLQYARLNVQASDSGTVFGGGTNALLVGTDPTFASLGAAATVRNAQTNVYGVNAEWAITPTVGLFGRFAFANTSVSGLSELNTNTYHGGVSVSDVFGAGNLFAVAYGQPIRITSGPTGPDSGTQTELEAFLRIQISDRVSLTPDFQAYFVPGNVAGNPTLYVGTLRASFTF